MQDNLKKLLKKEMTRKNFLHLIAVGIIGILGFGGVISYLLAHASTPAVSEEAEDGTLNSNATVGSDSNASGGEYVKFGTAPSGGGSGSPVPMMSEYASYVLAPGGDFEFAQMATSTNVLPPGWSLSPEDQIGSPSLLSNVFIENGVGLILQVSDASTGAGACIQSSFTCQAPYYREIQCSMPVSDNQTANNHATWALTTRAGDDASICGEIDIVEGGWGEISGGLHTGTTSEYAAYPPSNGVLSGLQKYGYYVSEGNATVQFYTNDEPLGAPVAFPDGTPPADTEWYALQTSQGAGGVLGTTSPTVLGSAGQYVVVYDRFFVAG